MTEKSNTPSPMDPLPLDYARCKPSEPGAKCRNCRRWADHPDQTYGPRTAVVLTSNSKSLACVHVPISFLEVK